MKAYDYIVQEIKNIIHKFPQIGVRYEHDNTMHVLEVAPNEIFNSDTDYLQSERNFFLDFISKYPKERINFISDNAKLGLYKVDFEIQGVNYSVN